MDIGEGLYILAYRRGVVLLIGFAALKNQWAQKTHTF